MKTFKPRLSLLPEAQRALWKELAASRKLGFTLYGGTAIALRLGHRASVDFDFFSDGPLDKAGLRRAMPALHGEVLHETPDTLVQLARGVKVSFFGGIAFGRFGDPEITDDGVMSVASLDDLMATKLKVILDRVEQKDYEDLAAMIAAGVDVARGLAIARQMFSGLSPQVALKALAYHADVPGLPARARKILISAAKAVSSLPDVPRRSARLAA